MATTYKHKRSSVGTNIPSTANLDVGELGVNLSSGKIHTRRSIRTGTLVGTVVSATADQITLDANPLFTITGTPVLRSSNSGTDATSPAISTVVFGAAANAVLTVNTLMGNVFAAGDFVWAETGAVVNEVIVVGGHSSAGVVEPTNPLVGDIWVDLSMDPPMINIFGTDSRFDELVTGGGGGGGDFSGTSLSDPDAEDMDFGPIGLLADTATALDTTYSAVDYDFGGVRSPRPGPNFGDI